MLDRRWDIVDTKLLQKPQQLKGPEASWANWSFKSLAYVACLDNRVFEAMTKCGSATEQEATNGLVDRRHEGRGILAELGECRHYDASVACGARRLVRCDPFSAAPSLPTNALLRCALCLIFCLLVISATLLLVVVVPEWPRSMIRQAELRKFVERPQPFVHHSPLLGVQIPPERTSVARTGTSIVFK